MQDTDFGSKEAPKILYIITKLELGGAQKVCLSLFKEFSPNAFLMSGPNGLLINEVANHPNFIINPYLEREISLKGLWKDLFAFFFILKTILKLKKQHPNLQVHTHSSKIGFLGRIAAKIAFVTKIHHTVHGFGFNDTQSSVKRFFYQFLEQIGTLCSTSIVCVSIADKDLGSQLFWTFKRKAVLIRAAVNEKLFSPQTNLIKNSTLKLGTISCFKPQKNLVDMIKICIELKKRNIAFSLEIIGDGQMRAVLEELILTNSLTKEIILLGWINESNLDSIMNTWDVFLLTSLWEGLPCSLIQARLKKILCVCYDVGGISEVLKDGENGYLIPVLDKDLMVKRLVSLSENELLLNKLKFYKEDLSNFYLQSMICAHQDLYY